MIIDVQAGGIAPDPQLEHFVKCCAGFELGAFRNRISAVSVRLADVPEARDGKHRSSRVQVDLPGRRKVIAEVLDADLHVAIHRSLERAGWTLARRQQREPQSTGNVVYIQQDLGGQHEPDRAA